MAFTTGSVQLAHAHKLGTQLGGLFAQFGITGCTASVVEKYARKMGFGITGLTTGGGFPPFGSFAGGGGVAAALQNPAGLTRPNGITIGANAGQTVGIYFKGLARDGADATVTNSASGAVAGKTFENFSVIAGLTATIYFGSGTYGVA
jgi:hypothetical protein